MKPNPNVKIEGDFLQLNDAKIPLAELQQIFQSGFPETVDALLSFLIKTPQLTSICINDSDNDLMSIAPESTDYHYLGELYKNLKDIEVQIDTNITKRNH